MMIRGFLNFDEAMQYARQLNDAETLTALLHQCRSLVISEQNLTLVGTRYSFHDYDEFFEKTFVNLPISDEELLQIPTEPVQAEEEDSEGEPQDNGDAPAPPQQQGTDDFDPFFGDDFF